MSAGFPLILIGEFMKYFKIFIYVACAVLNFNGAINSARDHNFGWFLVSAILFCWIMSGLVKMFSFSPEGEE